MKRRLQKAVGLACIMAMACTLLVGCGGKGSDLLGGVYDDFQHNASSAIGSSYDSSAPEEASYESSSDTKVDESGNSSVRNTTRKLIRTVNMTVETKEFDQLMEKLGQEIEALGGYVESKEVYNGSIYSDYRSSRDASLKIRIPQDHLDEFLETVNGLGNVTRSNEGEEDITLTYVDLESHKQALETEQERLLELLAQAESIEDIITIESRLSDLRYQLQSMESQLRTYDNQVDYSTVYMDVEEVQELTPVHEETPWERIAGGFMESLRDVFGNILEAFIWVLANLPHLVAWGIIIALVVWLGLRLKKVSDKRKGGVKDKAMRQITQATGIKEDDGVKNPKKGE